MSEQEKVFNVNESKKNQVKVWETSPEFAPASGICWGCKEQIYSPIKRKNMTGHEYTTGIDIEQSKRLITGCPHCNKSYCD